MIEHGPWDAPFVALTFDDGPGGDTPAVLDALAGREATFFLHGGALAGREDVVRRIAREGHEVANHALTHTRLARRPLATLREVAIVQRRLETLTGARPRAFRPPYGSGGGAARLLGLTVVGWDVDPRDWTRPGPEAIADLVLDAVRPGSIVLLHDGRGDRSGTAAAVPRILAGLDARGLRPVTVKRLLRHGA